MERTYVMLKPDCVRRGLVGEVLARIEKKGYRIADARMLRLDEDILKEHYAHLKDKPYFSRIASFMMSGPVLGLIVEGENAVQGVRVLMGATAFEDRVAGSIRGDFSTSTNENLIHGSDSAENAELEIKRFFK